MLSSSKTRSLLGTNQWLICLNEEIFLGSDPLRAIVLLHSTRHSTFRKDLPNLHQSHPLMRWHLQTCQSQCEQHSDSVSLASSKNSRNWELDSWSESLSCSLSWKSRWLDCSEAILCKSHRLDRNRRFHWWDASLASGNVLRDYLARSHEAVIVIWTVSTIIQVVKRFLLAEE